MKGSMTKGQCRRTNQTPILRRSRALTGPLNLGASLDIGTWSWVFFIVALASRLLAAPIPADWKFSQPVQVPQAGFQKIILPVATLDAARSGLEDLRFFDDAGREVPYLVERPTAQPPVTRPAKSVRTVLGDRTTALFIETGVAQPFASLTLQTAAASFLKSAVVEGSVDGAQWEAISVGEPLFRQSGATRLSVPLPPRIWAFLRVTVDDRRTPPVIFTGATLHTTVAEPAPEEPLEVTLADRDEQPGETRLTLRFAGANVALTELALRTSDPLFARPVQLAVRELTENELKPRVVATDSVSRVAVEGQTAVARPAQFDAVRLPMSEMLLTILNGDSPPLNIEAVSAKQRPVYLAFHAPHSGTFHLASGNASASAPHYDLAALGAAVRADLQRGVTVGARVANPSFRAPQILPNLHPEGAAIDLGKWRYRKRLEAAAEDVLQLELDVDVLSRAAQSLADLRLVESGRQLPYIVERTSLQRSVTLNPQLAGDPKRPSVSRWGVTLPRPRLPLTRLEFTSRESLFHRNATLIEEVKSERGEKMLVVLGAATWVRTPESAVGKLALLLTQPPRTDQLWLEVDNGDNAPLALENWTAWHSTARLLFKPPPGAALHLYYGNSDASAPRYDLQLVARQLLAAEKFKAQLRGEESLRKAAWSETYGNGGAGVLFWIALGGVVLLLIVVLVKLLPKPEPPK